MSNFYPTCSQITRPSFHVYISRILIQVFLSLYDNVYIDTRFPMLFFLVTFIGVFCYSKYDFFELPLAKFTKITLAHSSTLCLIPKHGLQYYYQPKSSLIILQSCLQGLTSFPYKFFQISPDLIIMDSVLSFIMHNDCICM